MLTSLTAELPSRRRHLRYFQARPSTLSPCCRPRPNNVLSAHPILHPPSDISSYRDLPIDRLSSDIPSSCGGHRDLPIDRLSVPPPRRPLRGWDLLAGGAARERNNTHRFHPFRPHRRKRTTPSSYR